MGKIERSITRFMNDEPVVYDIKDLQRILKVGRNVAYELMKSDCFPSIKIGKKRVVYKENLEEWLKDNAYSSIILD